MKAAARKFFAVYPILTLLIASASMNSFASGQHDKTHSMIESSTEDFDHDTLVSQYVNLAREMQAKEKEQQAKLKRKLRSGNFKKNGWHFKSRAAFRIRGYKKAAIEYLEKAAYHRKMTVEKTRSKSVVEQN